MGRIPSAKARERVANQVLKPQYQLTPLTFAQTAELIANECTTSLAGAHFDADDRDLVPEAGSCTKCPKRVGNMPDANGQRPDTCTDVECFRTKERAEWIAWQHATTTTDGLVEALSPEASAKALANGSYVRLSDVPPEDVLAVQDGTPVRTTLTWAKLTKDRGLKCVVARDKDFVEHTLVDIHQAIAAARLNGHETLFRDPNKPRPKLKDADEAKSDWQEAEKAREKKKTETQQVADEIFRRLAAAAHVNWSTAQFAAVIKSLGKHACNAEAAWLRRGFKTEKHEDAGLATMSETGLKCYLLEMALGDMVSYDGDLRPQVAPLCAAFGVKWKEIDREVRRDLAAKAKAPTAKEAVKKLAEGSAPSWSAKLSSIIADAKASGNTANVVAAACTKSFADLYGQGKSFSEIARALKWPFKSVQHHAGILGVTDVHKKTGHPSGKADPMTTGECTGPLAKLVPHQKPKKPKPKIYGKTFRSLQKSFANPKPFKKAAKKKAVAK